MIAKSCSIVGASALLALLEVQLAALEREMPF